MKRVLLTAVTAVGVWHAPTFAAAPAEFAAIPRAGAVTAVSLSYASGRAELRIGVDGDVSVKDFSLAAPHRIVVDLEGATLKMAARAYDKLVRGGITNVRVAAFNATTVRVVMDLDRARNYDVARVENDVRVAVESSSPFEPWNVAGGTKTPAPRIAPAARDSVRASAEPREYMKITPPAAAPVVIRDSARKETVIATPVVQQVGGRISITFVDTDLREALQVFSDHSGRSIVTGLPAGQIKINADIRDVPWQTALQSILEAYGLVAVDDPRSGIITVTTFAAVAAKTANESVVSVRIPLNYAKADVLAPTIQALLSTNCGAPTVAVLGTPPATGGADASGAGAASGAAGAATAGAAGATGAAGTGAPPVSSAVCPARGRVVPELTTNSLVIFEVQSHLDSLVKYVADFDIRPQQVNIKAQIISINRTKTTNLGISYDLGSANAFFNTLAPRTSTSGTQTEFQVGLGGDVFAGVANATRNYKTNSAINLIYNTTIGGYSLTSFIDALAAENLSDVTAVPSVNTVDKKAASLFVGNHVAYLITPQTAPGAVQAQAAQIGSLDVGIKLDVTPSISANRMVRLTLSAEQSSPPVITVAGPNYSSRKSTNEVLVRDGETVVISGLTQETSIKNRRGIPILSELPLIGRLFSENDTQTIKDDLIILITPRILDDPIPGRQHHP